jgi:hypothetical protein
MGKDNDSGSGLKLKRMPRVDDLTALLKNVELNDKTPEAKKLENETGKKKSRPALTITTNIEGGTATSAPTTTSYTRRSPITTFAQAALQIAQETDDAGVREAFVKRERIQVELRSDPLAPPRQKLKLADESDSPTTSPRSPR